MTINTKFDLEQEVWLIFRNEVTRTTIIKIETINNKGGEFIKYYLDGKEFGGRTFYESGLGGKLFKTKEELIKSL